MMRRFFAIPTISSILLSGVHRVASFSILGSSVRQHQHQQRRHLQKLLLYSSGRQPRQSSLVVFSYSRNRHVCQSTKDNIDDDDDEAASSLWMHRGLLISTLAEGLVPNPEARLRLKHGLVECLLRQEQKRMEQLVRESVLYSPCAGPTDIQALNRMEQIDAALQQMELDEIACEKKKKKDEDAPIAILSACEEALQVLLENDSNDENVNNNNNNNNSQQDNSCSCCLRVVYVPTAMYALRADSTNTPGKQRQRARADAKSRRNEIVNLLTDLFSAPPPPTTTTAAAAASVDIAIAIVTVDLHENGSVKQHQLLESVKSAAHTTTVFPTTALEALTTWQPHLLYVQGGNTFWLYHCIESGNNGSNVGICGNDGWKDAIKALCRKDAGCFYIGQSAGGIVAGASLQTACWKGWDDPSIVPGRGSYDDWTNVKGLQLLGSGDEPTQYSLFPHMSDTWNELVEEKQSEAKARGQTLNVICLSDQQVCFVNGASQTLSILSSFECEKSSA